MGLGREEWGFLSWGKLFQAKSLEYIPKYGIIISFQLKKKKIEEFV